MGFLGRISSLLGGKDDGVKNDGVKNDETFDFSDLVEDGHDKPQQGHDDGVSALPHPESIDAFADAWHRHISEPWTPEKAARSLERLLSAADHEHRDNGRMEVVARVREVLGNNPDDLEKTILDLLVTIESEVKEVWNKG